MKRLALSKHRGLIRLATMQPEAAWPLAYYSVTDELQHLTHRRPGFSNQDDAGIAIPLSPAPPA